MNKVNKSLLKIMLHLLIPLSISLVVSYVLKVYILVSAAVIFGIMLIFMIPTDSFFSRSVDYQAKKINPTFRPSKLEIKLENAESTINFIVVVLALVICLVTMYLQYI